MNHAAKRRAQARHAARMLDAAIDRAHAASDARDRETDARADTRAAWIVDHGKHARAYDGHTPATIDGAPTFRGQGAGGCGRMRYGRVQRVPRSGALKLVPLAGDSRGFTKARAPSHGDAIGDRLVDETQQSLVARPASMPRPE